MPKWGGITDRARRYTDTARRYAEQSAEEAMHAIERARQSSAGALHSAADALDRVRPFEEEGAGTTQPFVKHERPVSGRTCWFRSCGARTSRVDYFLCLDHWKEWKAERIDECPACGQGKEASKRTCYDGGGTNSASWSARDGSAQRFFTYILQLDVIEDGQKPFYVGHTRELKERIDEHKHGVTVSTRGRNPKLVYFEIVPNRCDAKELEDRWWGHVNGNTREIRRWITDMSNLTQLLEFS